MKGQGALEYLLILAAVLAIAAIVIYVVSSAGRGAQEDALRKDCTRSVGSCAFYKTAIGNSSADVCTSTCKPCASLDKFLIDTGKEPAAAYNDACKASSPA